MTQVILQEAFSFKQHKIALSNGVELDLTLPGDIKFIVIEHNCIYGSSEQPQLSEGYYDEHMREFKQFKRYKCYDKRYIGRIVGSSCDKLFECVEIKDKS